MGRSSAASVPRWTSQAEQATGHRPTSSGHPSREEPELSRAAPRTARTAASRAAATARAASREPAARESNPSARPPAVRRECRTSGLAVVRAPAVREAGVRRSPRHRRPAPADRDSRRPANPARDRDRARARAQNQGSTQRRSRAASRRAVRAGRATCRRDGSAPASAEAAAHRVPLRPRAVDRPPAAGSGLAPEPAAAAGRVRAWDSRAAIPFRTWNRPRTA